MLDILLAASMVVDADALKAWIDENQYEAEIVVPPPAIQPPVQAAGYHLTFNDEFTDLSISNALQYDGSRWYTETQPCCMPGGDLHQSWPHVIPPTTVEQSNPFSIVDGALRIRLKKENNVWYGGSISTTDTDNNQGFAQQYGYWEARIKMPGPSSGPWLSFWAKSVAKNSPLDPAGPLYSHKGEIDILEYWGDAPAFWSVLHDWGANPDWHLTACKSMVRFDFYSDFHTYGMMWDASKMSFWFDNQKQCEVTTPPQFKQPYWAVLNLGMGGGYPHTATPNPSDMFVDWVRIWAP